MDYALFPHDGQERESRREEVEAALEFRGVFVDGRSEELR
jgi:hypothetical protein